ncbi:MAG TPA: hypothetical protein DCG57_03335 [Candidatus Riflebacteria bacterium]|nr:hypothetical protein [Candidatus Riflebacteria bacterium]
MQLFIVVQHCLLSLPVICANLINLRMKQFVRVLGAKLYLMWVSGKNIFKNKLTKQNTHVNFILHKHHRRIWF